MDHHAACRMPDAVMALFLKKKNAFRSVTMTASSSSLRACTLFIIGSVIGFVFGFGAGGLNTWGFETAFAVMFSLYIYI